MLFASNPWHFWIAVVLVLLAVVPAVIGVGLGYFWFVSRSRYPRQRK
jgi:hypothetical protein